MAGIVARIAAALNARLDLLQCLQAKPTLDKAESYADSGSKQRGEKP
jgi:hypothetical protein